MGTVNPDSSRPSRRRLLGTAAVTGGVAAVLAAAGSS